MLICDIDRNVQESSLASRAFEFVVRKVPLVLEFSMLRFKEGSSMKSNISFECYLESNTICLRIRIINRYPNRSGLRMDKVGRSSFNSHSNGSSLEDSNHMFIIVCNRLCVENTLDYIQRLSESHRSDRSRDKRI